MKELKELTKLYSLSLELHEHVKSEKSIDKLIKEIKALLNSTLNLLEIEYVDLDKLFLDERIKQVEREELLDLSLNLPVDISNMIDFIELEYRKEALVYLMVNAYVISKIKKSFIIKK